MQTREERLVYGKRWWSQNREHVSIYKKQHYEENREKIRQQAHEHYLRSKERINKHNKEYARSHVKEASERSKKWYLANTEKHRLSGKRCMEKLKIRRREIIMRLGGECFTCTSKEDLHLHHLGYASKGKKYSFLRQIKEAELNPEIFTVLCHRCHSQITRIEKNPEKVERFCELLIKSKRSQKL